MTQWLSLSALDTLFFRGPERFDAEAGGGAYLSSLFPPHPGTVFAALNRALLNGVGQASDTAFEHDDGPRARAGYHTSRGPWLLLGEHDGKYEVLLPAPLALVEDEQGVVHALRPSMSRYQTDLGGEVHLPEAPANAMGIKSQEELWLPSLAYQNWLNGKALDSKQIVRAKDLWSIERRTGLARDRENRTAIEGRLYSAAHIRPNSKLSMLVNLPGAGWGAAGHIPLGGEGRAVWVDALKSAVELPRPATLAATKDRKLHYTLTLITPGLGAAWGILPGQTVREGVPGVIVCCALGQPLRIGGFDTQMRMPERVRSARAAGSVWWLEADLADKDAILKLHNTCIGAANGQGYGHVMVGAWSQ